MKLAISERVVMASVATLSIWCFAMQTRSQILEVADQFDATVAQVYKARWFVTRDSSGVIGKRFLELTDDGQLSRADYRELERIKNLQERRRDAPGDPLTVLDVRKELKNENP